MVWGDPISIIAYNDWPQHFFSVFGDIGAPIFSQAAEWGLISDFACLQAINMTNSTTGDLVFLGGTKFYPRYAESSQRNTLLRIKVQNHGWRLRYTRPIKVVNSKKEAFSLTVNITINSLSNITTKDSFRISSSWGFRDCPWLLHLIKKWRRYWQSKRRLLFTNWPLFYVVACIFSKPKPMKNVQIPHYPKTTAGS